MASLKKGKKVVNQEDLRRLMREKKQASERQKRVESPYARYSAAGALSCAICNAPVKSALLWQTHVLGKQHKDRLNELKSGDSGKTAAPSSASAPGPVPKRAAAEPEPAGPPGKRARSRSSAERGSSSVALGLLAGHYDDDEDEGGGDEGSAAPPVSALPPDFFSSAAPPPSHSGSVTKAGEEEPKELKEQKEAPPEALPEGFFDDPVRDAKVRQVEAPKEQQEREWEEFQKELRQVSVASEAIVAEDDEEGRLERQIGEIDEQMECLRRVEELRERRERGRGLTKRAEPMAEEVESEEEEELMHMLKQDWRAKGALA